MLAWVKTAKSWSCLAPATAHVEPQYLTRKIPWAQFYGGEVVEINGLPATVCGEEYPDGKFPVKFTGCGWHARVNPQHVQRVPRLA
jgi:hypothetical protein